MMILWVLLSKDVGVEKIHNPVSIGERTCRR